MYKNEYEKSMETYKKLMTEYETIVNSEQYKEVCDTMPFDFLNAKQKVDTLKMFDEIGAKGKLHFKRAEDAISFMYGFVDVKNGMDDLLNGASYIVSAEDKAKQINHLVENNPYLPSNLKMPVGCYIHGVARECLKVLPSYPLLLKQGFKTLYVESCIDCLTLSRLKKLVESKMITKKDIGIVKASGSDEYKNKVNALREMFGLEHLFYEKHDINLVGTTFKNDDGSSRQDILADMKDVENIELTTQKGKFQKAPGVEKDSVAVQWEGKTIGFVPQGTVDAMIEKYNNPEYDAKFQKIVGGGAVSYGCEVELGIIAKELALQKEEEAVQEK
jgi:superfamily II helicase